MHRLITINQIWKRSLKAKGVAHSHTRQRMKIKDQAHDGKKKKKHGIKDLRGSVRMQFEGNLES